MHRDDAVICIVSADRMATDNVIRAMKQYTLLAQARP